MEFISNKKIQEMWKARRQQIYKEHLAGASYQELARKWHVASSRIGQIIQMEEEYDTETDLTASQED